MVDQSGDRELMVDAGCLSSGTACCAALTSWVMGLWHLSPGKIFRKGEDSGSSERRQRRMVDAGCLSSPALSNFSNVNGFTPWSILPVRRSLSLSLPRDDPSGATGLR